MKDLAFDLVVIGSGPAGQKAAIQAAKLQKNVLVIEKDPDPGGNSLYSGTIPSKTFRESILTLTRFYDRLFLHPTKREIADVTFSDLNNRLQKVIEDEKEVVLRQLRRNGVNVIRGTAHFENAHQLLVLDSEDRLLYRIKSTYFVVATGSKPRHPPDVPFDSKVILDSTTLLTIQEMPKTMIVLGGGVIGAEYASFFAALGTEVTVIDRKTHMLPQLDSEIGVHLQTALGEIGLKFRGNIEPEKIENVDGKAFVRFKDQSTLTADILLYALGRTASVDFLALDNAGIALNQKGYVDVNALFQTSAPHIYAVGDVIGGPSLASTSMEQGRLATRHAFGVELHYFPPFYPIGIYTIPEISSCGYTEDELKTMDIRYEVGRAYYYEIARSHIAGDNLSVGMFKLIFHAETLEILGIHVIGRSATEVIHIGQMAAGFNAKIDYFVDQIFNYPTYAEGFRIAALNGLNKIKNPLRNMRV
jgi:NAD(P) transhydrogenase